MFEAFKAGLYDFRIEDDPTRWREGYDFPAARDGRIVALDRPLWSAEGHLRLRLQHPAADLRRRPRARRRWRRCSTSNGSTPTFTPASIKRSQQLLRRQRAFLGGASGLRRRARPARAVPRRGARRHSRGTLGAAGLRRLGPRPGARASGARRCSARLATRCMRARCATRAARRWRSKSWSRRARRSGSRSPMGARWRRSASARACAWSTRCSSSADARASIST